jgi:hypothetical protein
VWLVLCVNFCFFVSVVCVRAATCNLITEQKNTQDTTNTTRTRRPPQLSPCFERRLLRQAPRLVDLALKRQVERRALQALLLLLPLDLVLVGRGAAARAAAVVALHH